MKEKVAIYCRLSEEDKNKQSITDEPGSIQNQKAMLCDYAERQEWEIYGIYSDDDYAGADRNHRVAEVLVSAAPLSTTEPSIPGIAPATAHALPRTVS